MKIFEILVALFIIINVFISVYTENSNASAGWLVALIILVETSSKNK